MSLRTSRGASGVTKGLLALVPIFVAIIALSVLSGNVGGTLEYSKKEMAELQAERFANTALALQSMPQGSIELKISGYSYRVSDSKIWLKYGDKEVSHSLEVADYDVYIGPEEYTKLEGTACLVKNQEDGREQLEIQEGCEA